MFTEYEISEIKKCKNPLYFVEKYVKIMNPIDGIVPLELDLRLGQDQLFEWAANERNAILLGNRQIGKTTVPVSFFLWFVLFNRYKNVMIFSHNNSSGRHVMNIIRIMYEELPSFLKLLPIESRTQNSISFENGSRITAEGFTDRLQCMNVDVLCIDDCLGYLSERNQERMIDQIYRLVCINKTKILISESPSPGSMNIYGDIYAEFRDTDHEFEMIWVA